MFSPKLLKFALTGAVVITLLGTAVLGANRWAAGSAENDPTQVAIDELTEIVVQQWCSSCDKRLYPLVPDEYQHWQGMTRGQLEALLSAQFPEASVLAFESKRVVVQFPAVLCADCAKLRWPQRGYIGLKDGCIAIFNEDGSLFRIYGEAPGASQELLKEPKHFSSPEECERWLINLTS